MKMRRRLLPTCAVNLGALHSSPAAAATSLGAGMFSKRKKKSNSYFDASSQSPNHKPSDSVPMTSAPTFLKRGRRTAATRGVSASDS